MVWVRHHDSEKILMSYKSENIEEEIKRRFDELIKKYKNRVPERINIRNQAGGKFIAKL